MCELPFSQCVHGRPEPVPPPKPPPAPRTSRAKATPRVKVQPRVPGTPATRAAPVRSTAPRKWTSPEELRPHVLATLQEAGGELDVDDVFTRLEERVGDLLRPGDHESNPQGELRWRAAARKARKALMDEGYLTAAAPGVWRLTESGLHADVTPEP
ncbi:hypothetical protein [Nocardioides dongkuii]|uniref:hypothetical protein n=1 Tax=Nocardioides dongkuii TaxID=2760089 RepID=UPI0015FCE8F0|nr:hypothetical protein [Nocardioides dongkuii]